MFNQARTSPWRLPRTLPCFVSTSSASVASFIVFLLHRGGEGYRVPGLRAGRIRGGKPRVARPRRARASAPVGVNEAGVGLVPAVVGVGAEGIALGLGEVLRQLGAAVAVEVGEARAEHGPWDAHPPGPSHPVSPPAAPIFPSPGATLPASIRLLSSGCWVKASRRGVSSFARMMQPARQMRAISASDTFHLYSRDAAWMSLMPWAYVATRAAYSASCTHAARFARSSADSVSPEGPERTRLAATRSSLSEDRLRASSAPAMDGTDTPRSSATCTVHLPVPFCPALSSTCSTSGLPVSGSFLRSTWRVVSSRKDSAMPWFHWVKRSASASVDSPSPRRSRSYVSASNCMSAYSMPLCTIFTKWPAPSGPTWVTHGEPSLLAAMASSTGRTRA